MVREKATNQELFFRGEVDRYTGVDLGSSYLPSGTLAPFLYTPLEAREQSRCRRRVASRMDQQFSGRPRDCPVVENISKRLLRLPCYCDPMEEHQERMVSIITGFKGG